jgi:predicted RNA-binding Zn-ribbon protein involved in translation (DUF1610 family)
VISWQEFISKPDRLGDRYDPTEIACPNCGAAIWKDIKLVARKNPGAYYTCFECGWTGFH